MSLVTDTQRAADERGFTTVWILGITMFVMVLGIAAFDIWHVFTEQRTLAARADAAAAAAAQAVDVDAFSSQTFTNGSPKLVLMTDGSPEGLARARLQADMSELKKEEPADCADANLATAGTVCATVTIVNPDASGSPKPSVTVTVKKRVAFTLFSPLQGGQTVTATAIASPRAS